MGDQSDPSLGWLSPLQGWLSSLQGWLSPTPGVAISNSWYSYLLLQGWLSPTPGVAISHSRGDYPPLLGCLSPTPPTPGVAIPHSWGGYLPLQGWLSPTPGVAISHSRGGYLPLLGWISPTPGVAISHSWDGYPHLFWKSVNQVCLHTHTFQHTDHNNANMQSKTDESQLQKHLSNPAGVCGGDSFASCGVGSQNATPDMASLGVVLRMAFTCLTVQLQYR